MFDNVTERRECKKHGRKRTPLCPFDAGSLFSMCHRSRTQTGTDLGTRGDVRNRTGEQHFNGEEETTSKYMNKWMHYHEIINVERK